MLANLRPDLSKENLKCTADCNPFFCPPTECNSFANSQIPEIPVPVSPDFLSKNL